MALGLRPWEGKARKGKDQLEGSDKGWTEKKIGIEWERKGRVRDQKRGK